jgi:PASTA domain
MVVIRVGRGLKLKDVDSRLPAPLNTHRWSRHGTRWRLIWIAVLALLTAACGGTPSPHSTASVRPLGPSPSNAAAVTALNSSTGTVPKMLGMNLAAARSALAAAGFDSYSWLYGCYRSPKIGAVVRQTPGGGARVPRTTHVDIYLQANNCGVAAVPKMLGMNLAAARSALAAAGFDSYSWLYGCYRSPKIGAVVRQTPGGGARVRQTTHVNIYLQANNC